VENNTLELNLGEEESLFFDMTRGRSTATLAPSRRPAQDFNAPFDTHLHQLLSQSQILKVEVPPPSGSCVWRSSPASLLLKKS